MNDAQMVLLVAELTTSTHPTTSSYDADSQLAADELNAENITQVRASMSGSEMWENTDPTEFAGLTDIAQQKWIAFCAIESHDPKNNGLAHQFVNYIFGTGDTLTALAGARNESVSQASLLGLGTVTGTLVAQARG